MTRGGAPSRNGRGSIVCERRAVTQTASREPKASAEMTVTPPAMDGLPIGREIERDPVHARDRQPEEKWLSSTSRAERAGEGRAPIRRGDGRTCQRTPRPEHPPKSTFRKVSTARRGGKEFVNPQATSGGCLQYEFRFRAESAGTRIASGRTGVPFLPYRSRFEVTPCVPPCAPVALLRGGGINGSRLEQCAQALGVGFASLFSRGDNSA